MYRFDYANGLLITRIGNFNLDDLREYLLTHFKKTCTHHFIGTYFRPGVSVQDTTTIINGTTYSKREINLSGHYVNTYDWDAIFFKASKTTLIHQFIHDSTRNRSGPPAAATD